MLKRTLSALLCLLTVTATMLSSCGETADNGSTNNADTTSTVESTTTAAETDYLDTLPSDDMGGFELRIYGVHSSEHQNFPLEAENGEIVNDALYARNRQVEETYNVKLKTIAEADTSVVTQNTQKSVTSGDDEYDIIVNVMSGGLDTLTLVNCLYDLLEVPYLNLEEGWWSREFYNNTRINGKLFFTFGDFAPMKFYAPYVMCVNNRLADEYDIGNVMDEVLDGTWTLDRLSALTADVSHDLDGDGQMTLKDFFAYAHVKTKITTYSHYTSAGLKLCEIDDNGTPVVSLDSEKSVEVVEKLSTFLGNKHTAYNEFADTYKTFMEGRALFYGNSTSDIIPNFREMKDDFAIIPCPKYDESQERYYSYINTYNKGGVAIPATCKSIEEVGLLLEVLAYLSYGGVRDAYFEITMKEKVARDEASAKILDMVFDNCYIDLNGIYNFANSATTLFDAVMNEKEFVSSYAAVKDKIDAEIEKKFEGIK